MKAIVIFLISYFFSIILLPFVIRLFRKLSIVDYPNERSVHKEPVPRMGGLLLYLIIFSILAYFSSYFQNIWYIIIPSIPLLICGVIDDLKRVNWAFKFIFQIISVVFVLIYLNPQLSGIKYFGFELNLTIGLIILFFFILGSINSLNMLDGMDGLFSGYSIILFYSLIFLNDKLNEFYVLILSSLGALAGFLIYNIRPAKIFLGDTGSLVIGYFIIISTIFYSINPSTKTLDLTFSQILLGIPILDTLRVMILRIFNKRNPFSPDKNHLHHNIYNEVNYRNTVFIIHIFTLLFVLNSIVYFKFNEIIGIGLYVLICVGFLFFGKIIKLFKYFGEIIAKYCEPMNNLNFKDNSNTIKAVLSLIPAIIFIGFLITFYPVVINISLELKTVLLISLILFFVLTLINFENIKLFRDFYFFINLILFSILSCFSETVYNKYLMLSKLKLEAIIITSIIIISVILFLFIIGSRSFFSNRYRFNNKDLIIFIVVILTITFSKIYQLPFPELFPFKIFTVFIFYMWYRLLIIYNENYKNIFYIFSSLLIISTLIFNI